MADNTLNFDLDAPAVPTLTLDPTPAAVPQEEKPAAAPAPEAQVNLTPEEQAMVDQFAQKIDITNSQQVLQYGSACQKKIGDFSEAALSKVSTKDLGEVGDMITDLIGELKSFDANEEQQKGIMGFFKKKTSQLDALKTKYDKTETNVEKIQSMLEAHQVQLLKDIAMLDKMYELNMAYFKELSMYILAGKKKLADVRANELQQAMDKAKASGLPEDAQAARDLADQCERFEKKLYDLELTRNISLQMGPQIRLLQNNNTMTAELFRIELQTRVVCAAAYREDGEDAPAFHPFGYQEIPESGQGGEGVCIGAGHGIVEDVRLTGEQPEGAERAFVAAFVPPYAVMSFGETVEADGSRMQAGTKQRLQAAFVEQHSVRDDAPRIPPVVKGPSDLFDVAPHQGLSARNDDENPIRNDMWGYRIDCPEKIGGGHVGYGGLAAAVASAVTAREVAAEGSLPHDGTQFVSRDAFVLYTGEHVECEPSAHSQAVLHPLSGIIRCLSSPR